MQKYIHLFPKLRIIDLGFLFYFFFFKNLIQNFAIKRGGLGVDAEGRKMFNFEGLNHSLAKFKEETKGQIELWMEPGRFFVALAGIIVSKVTQMKEKCGVKWIGISTGFNTLIRPILYNAYHPIHNLSRIDQPYSCYVEIVGPICEV